MENLKRILTWNPFATTTGAILFSIFAGGAIARRMMGPSGVTSSDGGVPYLIGVVLGMGLFVFALEYAVGHHRNVSESE